MSWANEMPPSHAFILEAIAQAVEQAESEGASRQLAEARWAKVLATGRTIAWNEGEAYLEGRARSERPRRPAGRKLRG
jgi:hypothetical protein